MSRAIVGGDFGPRDMVSVDLQEDRIIFERIAAPEIAEEPEEYRPPVGRSL